LIRSAKPSSRGADGQNAAQIWYVTRQQERVDREEFLDLVTLHVVGRVLQRPGVLAIGCSSYPGASMRPSSVMNSDAMSLRIEDLLG